MYVYIYLLQTREFINTKENIYKLGKSRQENLGRFKQYPKGSKLIIQLQCKNCDICEKALIKIFKENFTQKTDIGTEYFEGNPDAMRKIICDYINNEEEDQEDQEDQNGNINDVLNIIYPYIDGVKINLRFTDKLVLDKEITYQNEIFNPFHIGKVRIITYYEPDTEYDYDDFDISNIIMNPNIFIYMKIAYNKMKSYFHWGDDDTFFKVESPKFNSEVDDVSYFYQRIIDINDAPDIEEEVYNAQIQILKNDYPVVDLYVINQHYQEHQEYQEDEEEYLDPTISIMFPNYKDDESFGGKQKLIKVIIEEREIQYTYNLLIYYIDNYKCVKYERRVISNKCESWYYDKIILKKVIENNTIYNLNDKKFIKLLNNYKKNIKIHSEYNSYFKEQYYIYKDTNYNSIIDVVLENCIFNDEIYCDCCFPKSCGCSYIAINTKFSIEEYGKYNTAAYSNNNKIAIIDIDNTLYDYALLRKYTPYLISYTNNEYTIKNRNYEIIGLEEKIEVIENNTLNTIESSTVNTRGSEYLYKDGSNPFRPSHKKTRMVALLNDMKSNYIRITKNKTCTHKINEYTELILNLY